MKTQPPHIQPADNNFVLKLGERRFPIPQPIIVKIYNCMEAREEWHPAHIEWEHLRCLEEGWILSAKVNISFVNTVINFDIVGVTSDGGFEISIPEKSIQERSPHLAKLMAIDVLPGMTPARSGSEGYILLPCMSGTLHRFHHTVSREQRIVIYASQEQWEMKSNYNCVGMHTPDISWCAMVVKGDEDAEAVVRSHYGKDQINSIHLALIYRWHHSDPMLCGERAIRYYFFDPVNGGWSVFAEKYRSYLRNERGLLSWREKAEKNRRVLDFARSFVCKITLGYKKPSFDGKGDYQSTTSFDEVKQIVRAMREDGINAITTQLVGWNYEGHDGCYPTRFPVNPVEGGEDALRRLIAWGKSNNVIVSLHDNYADGYAVASDFRMEDVIVLRDGTPWRNIPWAGGFNWRQCPVASLKHAHRDLPRIARMGISGNYYLDAVGPCYTCHSAEHPANRHQLFAAFREIFSLARGLFGTLSTEVPYGVYYDLIDGVYLSEEREGLSKLTPFYCDFADEDIPFLAVVLHNGIRYHRLSDSKKGRTGALLSLAWGAMPFFQVTARPVRGAHFHPTYAEKSEYARYAYQLSCVEHVDLATVDLKNIERLSPEVYRTTYASGTQLLINTGDCCQEVANTVLAPWQVTRSDS